MATPTFTSITPAAGHPSGGYLVTIVGTNFEPHPSPAATGPTSKTLVRSVEVEIGGVEATDVRVFSSTMLTCLVPKYAGASSALSADPGLDVDLVIRNVGPPIESDTFADVFAYQRSDLTRTEGALRHVVRELVLLMRREILENIGLSVHVDYDSTPAGGLDIVELAGIPGISLFGPDMKQDFARRRPEKRLTTDTTTREAILYRHQRRVILAFEATFHTQNTSEMLALASEFSNFFLNNPYLTVDADTDDSSAGTVSFPMWLTDDPSRTGTSNQSSTLDMVASFELHGVVIDADNGTAVRWGKILDEPADVNADVGGLT